MESFLSKEVGPALRLNHFFFRATPFTRRGEYGKVEHTHSSSRYLHGPKPSQEERHTQTNQGSRNPVARKNAPVDEPFFIHTSVDENFTKYQKLQIELLRGTRQTLKIICLPRQ